MSKKISADDKGIIKSAEFSSSDYAHMVMFELDAGADYATVLKGVPVSIMTATHKDDNVVVIGQVTQTEGAVLDALAAKGENFVDAPAEKKGFDPMFWRGAASIVGQGLQIASGLTVFDAEKHAHNIAPENAANQKNALGMDVIGFAALNLTANFCNMIFGSQHKTDDNHTKLLKEQFNNNIKSFVEDAHNLPDPTAKAMDSRPPKPMTIAQKAYDFGRAQSITFGEVGLRTLGTMALIFPVNNLAPAFQKLREGDAGAAFFTALNTNPDGTLSKTGWSGVGMLAGKITSMLAKEKDPYNPKDPNFFDKFREDYAFKTSTAIESAATGYMMFDRLQNKKSTLGLSKEVLAHDIDAASLKPDYLGTAGNGVFLLGYGMRFGASVGSLDADKQELYAHAADALVQLKLADIPEALAGAALSLKDHFKADSSMTVTEVYTGIVKELEQQHNITIADLVEQQRTEQASLRAESINMDVVPPRQQISDAQYLHPIESEKALIATL
jgi:hypothetical protein